MQIKKLYCYHILHVLPLLYGWFHEDITLKGRSAKQSYNTDLPYRGCLEEFIPVHTIMHLLPSTPLAEPECRAWPWTLFCYDWSPPSLEEINTTMKSSSAELDRLLLYFIFAVTPESIPWPTTCGRHRCIRISARHSHNPNLTIPPNFMRLSRWSDVLLALASLN